MKRTNRFVSNGDPLYENGWTLVTIVFQARIDSSIDKVSPWPIVAFTRTDARHRDVLRNFNLIRIYF